MESKSKAITKIIKITKITKRITPIFKARSFKSARVNQKFSPTSKAGLQKQRRRSRPILKFRTIIRNDISLIRINKLKT